MTTVFDVPGEPLIMLAAQDLEKSVKEIEPPEWSTYIKTGRHRERPPTQKNWWYIRVAAILRKIYMRGPIGTTRLAAMFGGSADHGSKPNHAAMGSRSIIRKSLQQLQKAEMITTVEKKGRVITAKGQKFLDKLAHKVRLEIGKDNPEIMKY